MAGEVKRAVRMAERLRQELANLLTRRVRDPRVVGVTVTRVEMPDDLRMARVYVRLLEGGDDAARQDEALVGLGRAAGMLRKEATQALGLRYAPDLKFYYDAGQDKAMRIEELLAEVSADAERKRRSEE